MRSSPPGAGRAAIALAALCMAVFFVDTGLAPGSLGALLYPALLLGAATRCERHHVVYLGVACGGLALVGAARAASKARYRAG